MKSEAGVGFFICVYKTQVVYHPDAYPVSKPPPAAVRCWARDCSANRFRPKSPVIEGWAIRSCQRALSRK